MLGNIDEIISYLSTRKFTILWSGGKDSTAVLLWVLEKVPSDRFNILFIEVTGNTHPLNIQYVYDIADMLGVKHKLIHARREDLEFFECLKRWGFPNFGANRWCLNRFKQPLIRKYSYKIQILGMRRSDSHRRRNIRLMEWFRVTGNIVINPLFDWSKREVWSYIKKKGIPLNPCYSSFGHSGNCMFCPFHSVSAIIRTLNDPVFGEKIREALDIVSQKKKGIDKIVAYRYWKKNTNQKLIEGFIGDEV